MTETQASPEQDVAPAEPLYGAQDVAAALDTSGERAMAYSYFAALPTLGIPKAEADAMIQAIRSNQPYPPEQPPEQQATGQSGDPTLAEVPAEPVEGGAA